jgi:chondroitin AC lyase
MLIKKLFFIHFCFLVLWSTTFFSADAQKVDSSDVRMMLNRMQDLLSSNFPGPDEIHDLMHTMQPNGSWNNIDYQSTAVSSWPPDLHLQHVLNLAKSYANEASPLYKDKNLAKAIHQSLDFWLRHNFTSQNWWCNDIGVPEMLTDILILMHAEINQEELLRSLNQMRGSYIDQTGQNRVWRAGIQLKIGLLEYGKGRTNLLGSSAERIEDASKTLQEEIVVGNEEGIQPDWSFHQHGVQQQFGNYGLSFALSQAEWAWILKDTPFQYNDDKIKILKNFILKGLSVVVCDGVMDISACGRQLFPGSPRNKGEKVISILKLMSEIDQGNTQAYSFYINRLLGRSVPYPLLAGNIYFWRSDLMVNRTLDYYISVRMCSKYIQSTESGNGENLLGAHLSDGATYLYLTGKEYQDIFPIWNWHRVPGVTSYVHEPLPSLSWGGLYNESNFVGGLSDSIFGINSMLFKRNRLTAYKSWFFGPQGVVCLGAGIHSDKNTDVSTTLNQSLLHGDIVVEKNKTEKTITLGHALNGTGIDWVYYDHTGYIFLQKNAIHVSADVQTGNWKRVYSDGSPKPVTGEIFNLWIDHGNRPVNGSYAYAILPDINKDSLTHFVQYPSVKIMQNDTILQAIQYSERKITQAVFYRAGKIKLDKHTILQTDNPCILMMKQSGRALRLTMAIPPEHGRTVTLSSNGFPEKSEAGTPSHFEYKKEVILSLSGHYSGENCSYDSDNDQTRIVFNMPGSIYEGKSITRILTHDR